MLERKPTSSPPSPTIALTTDPPPYSLARGFEFEDHELRVEIVDNRPPGHESELDRHRRTDPSVAVWIASDWAKALGYRDTNGVTRLLDDESEGTLWVRRETSTPGGMQLMVWLTTSGVWEVLALSRRPEAKQLRRWMTTEVMPQLMTAGFYLHPEAASAGVHVVGTPDTTPVITPVAEPAANTALTNIDGLGDVEGLLAAALAKIQADKRALAAKDAEIEREREIANRAIGTLADLAPAVQGTRQLHDERGRWPIDTVARMLKVGPHKLREWLRERKILIRPNGYDEPVQRHIACGRMSLRAGKSWSHPRTGEDMTGNPVVMFSAKGLSWISGCLAADRVLDADVDDVLARAEALISRALPPAKEDEQ